MGRLRNAAFIVDMVIASVVRICVEMSQLVAVCSEAAQLVSAYLDA